MKPIPAMPMLPARVKAKLSRKEVIPNDEYSCQSCGFFHSKSEGCVKNSFNILPNDYEACGECNLDHAYEPVQSLEWHKKNPGSYDTHYVAAADCPGTGKASKWHDTVDDEWLSCPNCKAQWATSDQGALTVPAHKVQYKR